VWAYVQTRFLSWFLSRQKLLGIFDAFVLDFAPCVMASERCGFLRPRCGIVRFTCSYGFVTFEQQEDAEKLMKREVKTVHSVNSVQAPVTGSL